VSSGGCSRGPSSLPRIGGNKIGAAIGGPGPVGPGAIAAGNDITGFGTLRQFDTHKKGAKAGRGLADFYAFETANDPDGSVKGGTPGPDSDVTDLTRFEGGYAVSDA